VTNPGHIKVDHNRRHRKESLKAAVAAARLACELARDQYEAGLVDFSNVQRPALTAILPESDGTATANLVPLYKDPDD
jgi:hypothetical protein